MIISRIHPDDVDFAKVALRSYRRYKRARYSWRRPFHEEFPTLTSLFCREGEDGSQHISEHDPPLVSREDAVTALMRLRGDADVCASRWKLPGWGCREKGCVECDDDLGGLCHSACSQHNYRREPLLARALAKIARCCIEVNVKSESTLRAALVAFDFSPADEVRKGAGCIRAVDARQWMWMMKMPRLARKSPALDLEEALYPGYGGGQSTQLALSGGSKGRDTLVRRKNRRLLDAEEMSVVLTAAAYCPLLGEEAIARRGLFVSISTLWGLLKEPIAYVSEKVQASAVREAEARVARVREVRTMTTSRKVVPAVYVCASSKALEGPLSRVAVIPSRFWR